MTQSVPFLRIMLVSLFVGAPWSAVYANVVIDFEDLPLENESFYNGAEGSAGFISGSAFFNNQFTDFGGGFTAWSGWSYSNVTDIETPGFENQYSAYSLPNGGGDSSENFAIAFSSAPDASRIELPDGLRPQSVRVTNSTYAALSMRHGDAFAKKFGGTSGDDPDWFLLTINGFDSDDNLLDSVMYYLADFRFEDGTDDYIVDTWTTIDLSPLGEPAKLGFSLASSDVGEFGTNTPTYFALDNLVLRDPNAELPADFNQDGVVDLADFVILKTNFGNTDAMQDEGDANQDGRVDLVDFNIFKGNLGNSATATVPEPDSIAYACVGFILMLSLFQCRQWIRT